MSNGLGGEFAAYSLVWSDEFDGAAGSAPDPRFWQPETGGHGWGNQELQYYTDSTGNAALDGAGHLAIVVRQAARRRHRRLRVHLRAADQQGPGVVPVRAGPGADQDPGARGIWPAFWMLGQDIGRTGWPGCGEIDVMEHFGTGPAAVQGPSTGPGIPAPWVSRPRAVWARARKSDFRVYSVAWEPGRIRWYVNGRLLSHRHARRN